MNRQTAVWKLTITSIVLLLSAHMGVWTIHIMHTSLYHYYLCTGSTDHPAEAQQHYVRNTGMLGSNTC